MHFLVRYTFAGGAYVDVILLVFACHKKFLRFSISRNGGIEGSRIIDAKDQPQSKQDTDDSRYNYEDAKENYVGVNMEDIKVYETEMNMLYGYADTNYKVIEFTSSGSYRMDINTFGDAYGVVRIDKDPNGGYYVSSHLRYSIYFNW